jgi:hypothetical protein
LFRSSLTGTFEFNATTFSSRSPSRRAPELGPGGWDATVEATVGAGGDVFSVDEFGERDDAISY